MVELCHWATAHWVRFPDIETPDTLDLSGRPIGAASWNIGPDGPVGPDGNRQPSPMWGGIALFHEREDADRAFDDPAAFLPCLDGAIEHWHALLLPIAHRGTCNHLDVETPGLMIQPAKDDPGGPLFVMTTAGFDRGPDFDVQRVIDFRHSVDRVRETIHAIGGNVARQIFNPHLPRWDGIIMTIWSDEAALSTYAYKRGAHRAEVERYKSEGTADRTSFTRFRPLRSKGLWEGRDPVEAARLLRAIEPPISP